MKSVRPPSHPPLRRPAPAPYFHLLFLVFQIPPSRGRNQIMLIISQHIENPGLVRTVYSGIFRDIQQCSAILRLIEGHLWILRHIQALLKHMEP